MDRKLLIICLHSYLHLQLQADLSCVLDNVTVSNALQGRSNPDSQANGAMMRVSPLGILRACRDMVEVAESARQDASLTSSPGLLASKSALLMLNPGLGPGAYYECEIPSFRRALLANLRQERLSGVPPFACLDPQFAWHGGFDYWNGKLSAIIQALAEARQMSSAAARADLSVKFACTQLLPYHSASFADGGRWLQRLESVRLAGEFVQQTVVERVRTKQAIAIVTRQVGRWNQYLPDDLQEEHGVIRYSPREARAAHLTPTSRGGRAILRHLGVL